MSERYSKCKPCAGPDCFLCGGTYTSGNALDYTRTQNQFDWEKEPRGHWFISSIERTKRLQKMEDEATKNPRQTKNSKAAMDAAILAVQEFIDRDKTRGMSSKIIPFDSLERKRSMSQLADQKQVAVQASSAVQGDMSNPFSSLANFEAAQRMAKALSQSSLIPKEYQNNIPNCLIALEISQRLRASALMVMQNLYIVHGKPGWSAQYIISAINSCGKFSPLRFQMDEKKTECIAYAIELKTGETLHGTKITMAMADQEGWVNKNGSKWKTMSEQMLRYRAASFFGKIYAPEILMGFQTTEEIEDIAAAPTLRDVKSEVVMQVEADPVHAETVEPKQEFAEFEAAVAQTEDHRLVK